MTQAQMKRAISPITIYCVHCQQEQIVHMQARTGFLQMAHQSVKCVKCERPLDLITPHPITPPPLLPPNLLTSPPRYRPAPPNLAPSSPPPPSSPPSPCDRPTH